MTLVPLTCSILQGVLVLLLGLCKSSLLQNTFSVDEAEVEAGQSVTFRLRSSYTPGYPASLVNEEVSHY